jgi:hypothetical protein
MAIDDQAVEATTSTATDTSAPVTTEAPEYETSSRSDPAESPDDKKRSDLNKALKAEFEKVKREPSEARREAAARRAREEQTGKFAPEKGQVSAKVEPAAKAAPDASTSPGQQATSEPAKVAPQGAAAAPASLSKDTRAIWDTLPEVVRNDIIKRESDTQRGVEQLKQRYQTIDEALAPYRPLLQQVGKTEGDAVKQLFAWHQALAGPNKAQAFQALARSHGFDLSTLAPASQTSQQQQDPNDPRVQLQQALHGTVSPLDQRLSALEQQLVRREQAQLQDEIGSFSKDKPHFDRVRYAMGQMMASGYATSLQDAYDKAVWADPEMRTELLSAEQAKREAEAQAAQQAQAAKAAQAEADRKAKEREAMEKARRAMSPRSSSPMGSAVPKASGGKSIRESLAEARRQVSGGSI